MRKMMHNERGLTLIELVVTMVILGILGSLVLPAERLTAQRTKELQLSNNLRLIRDALDAYKKDYDKAVEQKKVFVTINKAAYGYPETLKTLVEGSDFNGLFTYKKKYLRRIPSDPFHPEPDDEKKWGLRSYADEPDSSSWGGEDVFDVYSLSDGTAINGTKYKDW